MRSERWSIHSKKYEEQCGSGLVVRDEAKHARAMNCKLKYPLCLQNNCMRLI